MSRSGATALVVLASVLLVGASVAGYARLAFFNSGQFANRASAALAQPAVRTAIGERVHRRDRAALGLAQRAEEQRQRAVQLALPVRPVVGPARVELGVERDVKRPRAARERA